MAVEWKTAGVGSGTPGRCCRSLLKMRRRGLGGAGFGQRGGCSVSGVENVVLGVSNLDASIALFRKAYGWSEPVIETQKDFGKLAYFRASR